MTTKDICEALTRYVEESGEDMFENNFIEDGEIKVSILCIVGPHAAELSALVREWAHGIGMKRMNLKGHGEVNF